MARSGRHLAQHGVRLGSDTRHDSACWPQQLHLAHKIAVLADQRLRAGIDKKVGLTTNKTTAAIRVLGLKADTDCYKEFRIGASRHQRYSPRAIERIRDVLRTRSADEIWAEYRTLAARRPKAA